MNAFVDNIVAFHAIADCFPLIEGSEFDELVADIRAHGLQQAIIIFESKVLDGRNRYRACLEAGVEPRFREYRGDDPVGFAISLNLCRRHLNATQRAMIADKLAALPRGANQHAQICAPSQERAAELLNISRRSVQHARDVRARGVDVLVRATEGGNVAVSLAAEVAQLPREEQKELLDAANELIETDQETDTGKAVRRALVERYTGCFEWYTPTYIVESARAVLGAIDLDPATSLVAQQCVRATRFYTQNDDGLEQSWSGTIFLNPPYSSELIGRFVDKLVSHVLAGEVSAAILLTDSRSDAKWFHKAARCAQRVCLTLGRIRFMQPGGDAQSPVNGSALFYLGPEPERFEEEFGKFGIIYREPIL